MCLLLAVCGCGGPGGSDAGREGSADATSADVDGALPPQDGAPAADAAGPISDAAGPVARDAAPVADAAGPAADAARVADATAPADAGVTGRLHLVRFGMHWVGFAGADRRYRAAGDGAERVDFAGGGLHVRGELR
jgi:hypothetical protein